MATKTYRVRGIDLDHDGTRYPEGSTIELGDDEAAGKRRWLEPVAATEPLTLAGQAKPAKTAKADDQGQSADQGEGDKQ